MSKDISRCPHIIRATSPDRLQQEMARNNIIHDTEFLYFDIQKDGAIWIAWYYKSAMTRPVRTLNEPTVKEEVDAKLSTVKPPIKKTKKTGA